MNIVVLCGGISTEREISIRTGGKVCQALRTKGHRAIVLDVYCGNEEIDCNHPFSDSYHIEEEIAKIRGWDEKLQEVAKRKEKTREGFFGTNVLHICKMSDMVFMALHGEQGENGMVQAALELHGIPYTGTGPLGSAVAMDKGITKELFVANNIPTPKGMKLTKGESVNLQEYGMKFPCVVKPCCGGSSVGVSLVMDEADYDAALAQAFRYGNEIVIEEYIAGREFSVGVIEGKALPVIEIVPKEGFYDYTNKYEAGKTDDICPADLPEEIAREMQENAIKATKALRLGSYSRMDFLLDKKNQMYCLEANTLPGMTDTSLIPQEAAVLGCSYEDLCEWLIQVSGKQQ